jgi:CheY-like chemotaxis protein
MSDYQVSSSPGASPTESNTAVKTVLVVEDDEDIGSFLIHAISLEMSLQALLAPNGYEALELVERYKPDLFLLDYHLPGINGIQLYDRLHAKNGLEHVPAVMISANAPVKEIRQRKITYIKKPFELTDLLQTIEKLVAR